YFLAIQSYERVELPMISQGSLVAEKYTAASRRVTGRGLIVLRRLRKKVEGLPLAMALRRSR
ncbi:MAG: hypothetical protein RLN85_04425, partial [Pseudomonadales bacterium]